MALETFEDNTQSLPESSGPIQAAALPPVSMDNVTPEPLPPISLEGIGESDRPISKETATKRTDKIIFGLAPLLPGKTADDVYQALVTGQEGELRKQAATAVDLRDDTQRNNIINNIAREQGGSLTKEQIESLNFHIDAARNRKPTNPASVVEKQYAEEWMKYLDITSNRKSESSTWSWADTELAAAAAEMPDVVSRANQAGVDIGTKNQFMQTKIEQLEDKIKNEQTYLNWGYSNLKLMFPGYEDLNLRGISGDTSYFEGLLGTQKNEEVKALRLLPVDQFVTKVDPILDTLYKENPQLALVFAHALKGMSSDDVVLGNVFNLLDLTTIPAGKMTAALVRKVGLYNATQQATRDTVEGLTRGVANKATLAASAGDVGEAAVQKATANLAADVKGTPNLVQRQLDAVVNYFRVDKEAVHKDPGFLGQSIVNEMDKRYDKDMNTVVNAVANVTRVERTNELDAAEKTIRALKEDMLSKLTPAAKNNVANIFGPFPDTTGTKYFEILIGKKGGEGFINDGAARSFAKANGIIDPEIVSDLEKQGVSRFIKITKHIDETHDIVRDGYIELNKIQDGRSTLRDFFSLLDRVRTPDEIFEPGLKFSEKNRHNANRKVAMIASSILTEASKEIAKDVETLRPGLLGSMRSVEVRSFAPEVRTDFTTAKGSTYTVQRDGTTIRNKAVRSDPGHEGDYGLKPVSAKTVYLTEVDANRLAPPKGNRRFVDHGDGTLSLATQNPRTGWNVFPGAMNVPYSTTPKAGLRPLELWTQKDLHGATAFSNQHFGNKITEVRRTAIEPTEKKTITRKERWNDLKRVYNASREQFFKGVGELENYYMQNIKRLPDIDEIHAYFAASRLDAMDDSFKNLWVYRSKARLGTETHTVFGLDKDGNRVNAKSFDGRILKELPTGDHNVAFIEAHGTERVVRLSNIVGKRRDILDSAVKEGRIRLVEVFDAEARPLQGHGNIQNQRISYVITRNLETKPLSLNQISRQANRFVTEYPYYIKQAKIMTEQVGRSLTHWYEGDTHVMPIALEKLGKDVVQHMNAVRTFLKDNKIPEAKAYSDQHLPMDWQEVHGWFQPSKGIDGIARPPHLDLHEPFQLTRKNISLISIDKEMGGRYPSATGRSSILRDGTKEGLARQNQLEYGAMRRDDRTLMTISDKGTVGNPSYHYEPAKILDLIPTMDKSLNKIINSTFLDDYKIYGIERWISKAEPWLKGTQAEIRSASMHTFYHPDWKPDTPLAIKNALKAQNMQIQDLMRVTSETDKTLHSISQRLADSIYAKHGSAETQGLLGRTYANLTPWAIANANKVPQLLRMAVFHKTMGMLNWVQVMVQSMTYVSILGLAGRNALPGTMGGFFHQLARMNKSPEFIDALDRIASKMSFGLEGRWRPGEFKEAIAELAKTNFAFIGRNHIQLEWAMSPKIINNGVHNSLDAMTFFFKGAERNMRFASWYTAFREFKDIHPTGRITNADRGLILERADMLAGNMTLASKSALQKGVLEFPSQFLSYQLRLTEQFLGKRLSTRDRIRLVSVYAATFGLPGMIGVTGLPTNEYIRSTAIDNGYVVGDNFLTTTLMEGVPSALGGLATGTHYNVGNRWGPSGIPFFKDILSQDKSWMEIFGGAAGTSLESAFTALDPFWEMTMSLLKRDGKFFPVTTQDFLDVAKEVSTYNNWTKFKAALATHNWISKKEGINEADVSAASAIFRAATGLTSQEDADIHAMTAVVEGRKKGEKYVEDNYVKYYRRAQQETENKNYDQASRWFARATAYLEVVDYPVEKMGSLLFKAQSSQEDLISKLDYSVYTKDVPPKQREQLLKALIRKQELQKNRKSQ